MLNNIQSQEKDSFGRETPLIVSSIYEEKSNLLTIMEKNDKILNLSQLTLAKDKQNLLQSLKSSENMYKVQIQSLTEENQTYTSEISRLNQKISALTQRLEQATADQEKSKEKFKIISQSLLEANNRIVKIEEKYLKLKTFSKNKEEKLQAELTKANSSLQILQSDFSVKLESLSQKPSPKPGTKGISQEQFNNLITQKKDLEKSFLTEKNLLNSEIRGLKKELRIVQKELEKEKKTTIGLKQELEKQAESKSKEIETKHEETQQLSRKFEIFQTSTNQDYALLKQEMIEKEEEFVSILQELTGEFQDYKKYAEEIIKTKTEIKEIAEIVQEMQKQFVKIKNLKKSLNINLDCIGKVIKEFYSLTPFSFPLNSHSEYSSEHLKILEDLSKTLKSVTVYSKKLENNSETINKFFQSHSEELINSEKQKLHELIELTKENHSLSSQFQELLESKCAKFEATPSRDFKTDKLGEKDQEKIAEILKTSKSFLETLKKKMNSFKVKQTSELEAWTLRENLYKKTIQSLNTQLMLQSSQMLEIKKLASLKPSTYEIHISELQKELSDKSLKLEILSQDYSSLQQLQKELESSFEASIIQVSSTKRSETLHLSALIETHLASTLDSSLLDKVRPFLMTMNSYREAFTSSSESTNVDFLVRSLELYYSSLLSLETRLYLERTSIKLIWYDSYTLKSQSFSSFQLEKTAVLYCLASLWSRIGVSCDLKSPNGHKIALNAFQTAFGLLTSCQETLQSLNSMSDMNDLSIHNLTIWSEVIKASGYLTMFDKLDKRTASKPNLQKLAFTIHKRLDAAVSHIHLVPAFPKETEKILRFSADLFLAVTEMYSGLIQKDQVSGTGKGFGESVARLRKANELCKNCESVKGITGKAADLFKEFSLLIKNEMTKAEEENYAIYMESIPAGISWSIVEEVTLFKGKELEIRHFPEKELINLLMPVEVLALHEEFEHRMTQEFLKTSQKVEKELEKFERFFNVNTFKGLPQNLWNQISAQQAQTIEKQIESLQGLCQSCLNELVKNREKLMAEEAEDEQNRSKFPSEYKAVPSCICNADLKIEIEKTLKSIHESQKEDVSLINEFKQQESRFKELTEDKEHFDQMIPKLDANKESEKDLLVGAIKEAAQGLRKSLSELKTSIFRKSNYEILKKIYKDRLEKETVFNEIRVETSYLQIEIEKQLEKTTPKIEKFFKEFAGLSVENRAAKVIQNLSKLLEKKQSVAHKFDERLVIYSTFLDEVSKISAKVDEFLAKRMYEKQDIFGRQTLDRRSTQRHSESASRGSSNAFSK